MIGKFIRFTFGVFGFFVVIAIFSAMLQNCGGSGRTTKSPVDLIIRDMNDVERFTILLYDMDVEGSFVKTYKHQYQVITEGTDGEPVKQQTQWYEVDKKFFERHQSHMGMEIASKSPEAGVQKEVAPPGYSNYVGNSRYGQWRTNNDGSSFWEFYGKYAMLSSLFNLGTNPIRRSYYDDYRNYRGSGRTYYGPTTNGNRYYGTGSRFNKSYNQSSTWSRKASQSSFKNRVRNEVSPSSNRKSRSSSRYRSSSSYRSRSSGSFGK